MEVLTRRSAQALKRSRGAVGIGAERVFTSPSPTHITATHWQPSQSSSTESLIVYHQLETVTLECMGSDYKGEGCVGLFQSIAARFANIIDLVSAFALAGIR